MFPFCFADPYSQRQQEELKSALTGKLIRFYRLKEVEVNPTGSELLRFLFAQLWVSTQGQGELDEAVSEYLVALLLLLIGKAVPVQGYKVLSVREEEASRGYQREEKQQRSLAVVRVSCTFYRLCSLSCRLIASFATSSGTAAAPPAPAVSAPRGGSKARIA